MTCVKKTKEKRVFQNDQNMKIKLHGRENKTTWDHALVKYHTNLFKVAHHPF